MRQGGALSPSPQPSPVEGEGVRSLLVLGGLYYYAAAVAGAGAAGFDVRVVGEGDVDDPALVGRHGLEGDRATAGGDPKGDFFSEVGEGLVAPLLVAGDVDEDADALLHDAGGYEGCEELEGAEGLAAASYEESGVVAVDVEHGATDVFAVGVPQCYGHFSACEGHDVLKELGGECHDVGGLFEHGDANLGGLGADSEYAGLAVANDVYFDVLAVCV